MDVRVEPKESWTLKNFCFWTVVLEKTLESPLDCKEIQLVHPKGDQLSVHWKDWIWSWNSNTLATSCKELTHWKRPWCWRDWGKEEKGTTEDEMAGWHHQLNGREFEWTPGVGDGQGGLVCCDSWGRKESDTTERLNWIQTEGKWIWYSVWAEGKGQGNQKAWVGLSLHLSEPQSLHL